MDLIKFLADHGELVFTVCQVMVAGVMLYLSTKFASKREVSEARELGRAAHERLNILDERLKGLPTYDVTNDLSKQLSRLTAGFAELKAEIRGIDDRTASTDSAVTRIQQHLLSKT